MSNEQRIREKIAERVFNVAHPHTCWGITGTTDDKAWREEEKLALALADQILAIEGLVVLAEDQSLPVEDFDGLSDWTPEDAYREAQQDMLKAGWVKGER